MSTFNRFGTPRAYVDMISFHLANGWRDLDDLTIVKTSDGSTIPTFDVGSEENLYDMRPSDYAQIANTTKAFRIEFNTGMTPDALSESSFLAILNHNFHSADVVLKVEISDEANFDPGDANYGTLISTTANHTKVINARADSTANYIDPEFNGWTLITWTKQTDDNQRVRITFEDDGGTGNNFDEDVKIGSIMYGEYFDFPQSPDLDITTTIEYDGTTLINSTGGSTFANSSYLAQPTWSATNPWTNTDASNQQTYGFIRRNGRLRHSMNFSYLADTNIFTESMHHHDEGSGLSLFYDAETMHSNFYNRIFGQHLPFLFSIDKDSTSEGDYGMFRLANNSLKTTQVASRTWNVGLDLVESW
mgnify:CR=1 FL=1